MTVKPGVGTEALSSQSLHLQAQVTLASHCDVANQEVAQCRMRVDQCVCAFRAVELPVLSCLSSKCSEVTEVEVLLIIVVFTLMNYMQNYGDIVNVILLYLAVLF